MKTIRNLTQKALLTIFCMAGLFTAYGQAGTASDPIDDLGKAHNLQSGRYHFNINGSAFQADVDNSLTDKGWILILQYVHQAGTTPNLNIISSGNDLPVASTTPLGGNESGDLTKWGHAGNAFLSDLGAAADELRFYGLSSGHNRVVHFFTSTGVGYAKTGTGSMTGLESNFTALSGHTANLPAQSASYQSNQQNDALVNRPFYKYPNYTWRVSSSRWEVDDSPNNAQNSTIHKAWIRASVPVNLDGSNTTAETSGAGTSNTTVINDGDGEIIGNAYVGKLYGDLNAIASFGHENSQTDPQFAPGYTQNNEGQVYILSFGNESQVPSPRVSIGAGSATSFGGNNIELKENSTTFYKRVVMQENLTLFQNVNTNNQGLVFENGDTIDDDQLDSGAFGGINNYAYYKVPNKPSANNPGFAVMSTFISPIFKVKQSTKNYSDYTSGEGYLDDHIQANGLTEINGYLHVGLKPTVTGSVAPTLNDNSSPDKIDGAVAHFDGRVYVSESDIQYPEEANEKGLDTAHSAYKHHLLWVEKGIVTPNVALVDVDKWHDYVFNEDYKLNTIEQLQHYIKENGHLPTMPSEKYILENGFDAVDMTGRLVKTVEELTLHTINQEEALEAQNKKIEGLKDDLIKQKEFSEKLLIRLEKIEKKLNK